jgi:hypothetical protein
MLKSKQLVEKGHFLTWTASMINVKTLHIVPAKLHGHLRALMGWKIPICKKVVVRAEVRHCLQD